MRKILVITANTPSLINLRMEMMETFQQYGYDVIAVGNEKEDKWADYFNKKNIGYVSVPVNRNGLNPFQDIKTIKAIRELYQKEKPEKVFLYHAKPVVYGSIAARKFNNIDVYNLISGLGSVFRGANFKSKVLRQIMKIEYRYALKKTSVIFHNSDDKNKFIKWKLIKSSQGYVVHGSGVDVEKFAYEPVVNENVFLMVSRVIRDKGVMEYLEASRIVKQRYPETKFILVGGYDTNPTALKPSEVEGYFGNEIEYAGLQSDVFPYIRECGVFVLPSYHEGRPKSVLEAMAVGRAIITTNAPGCRETVKEGVNGYLVDVKSVDSLVEKMELLLEHPQLIHTMGKESRRIAQEEYDVNKVNMELLEIMNIQM